MSSKLDINIRLDGMKENAPRLENSWYGPIQSYLDSLFTSPNGHMVKPQGALRKPAKNQPKPVDSDEDSDTSLMSLDSSGDLVISRKLGGQEKGIMLPDFIVTVAANEPPTRFEPHATDPNEDKIDDDEVEGSDIAFLLVEVKIKKDQREEALDQVERYLKRLQQKSLHDKTLTGLAVAGGWVSVTRLEKHQKDPVRDTVLDQVWITDPRIWALLQDLAAEW